MVEWWDRIVLDTNVLTGKPVIKGSRLAVAFIIDLLADGWTEQDILTNYPDITRDDILARLAYASDVLHGERVCWLLHSSQGETGKVRRQSCHELPSMLITASLSWTSGDVSSPWSRLLGKWSNDDVGSQRPNLDVDLSLRTSSGSSGSAVTSSTITALPGRDRLVLPWSVVSLSIMGCLHHDSGLLPDASTMALNRADAGSSQHGAATAVFITGVSSS